MKDDTISRQAAIDVVEGGAELIRRVLDNMDVVIGERGKFAYGLGLLESCIEELSGLPSAQPEIIRCKDCKHHHYDSEGIPYCDRIDYGYGWKDDDFCSRAERRNDG